jgi:hypothetical protein
MIPPPLTREALDAISGEMIEATRAVVDRHLDEGPGGGPVDTRYRWHAGDGHGEEPPSSERDRGCGELRIGGWELPYRLRALD